MTVSLLAAARCGRLLRWVTCRVRTGGGITRGGETMPRPDTSEYALVVRPRGDGVDSELAGWLTGLHGASAAGGQGAVGSFHRMCAALSALLCHLEACLDSFVPAGTRDSRSALETSASLPP